MTPTEFEDTIRVPGREDDEVPYGKIPISNVSTPVLETMLRDLDESSEAKLRDVTQIPIIRRELEKRNPGVVGQREREAEAKFQYMLALVRICSGIGNAREHFNDEDPTLFSISLQIAREGLQEAISITSSPEMARRSRYTSKVLETILQSIKDLPMKKLLPNSSSEVQRFLDTTIPKMGDMLARQLRIYSLMASILSYDKRRERRKSRIGQ